LEIAAAWLHFCAGRRSTRHILRHACSHKLANEGKDSRAIQDYLGLANAQSTVRYTQLSPERFKDFRW
jgi:type 1 fimbriae regulatory protein FimE